MASAEQFAPSVVTILQLCRPPAALSYVGKPDYRRRESHTEKTTQGGARESSLTTTHRRRRDVPSESKCNNIEAARRMRSSESLRG